MPMGRALIRTIGNLVPHSSKAKIKGKTMLGMVGMVVSTLFPQDLSVLGVKVSVI